MLKLNQIVVNKRTGGWGVITAILDAWNGRHYHVHKIDMSHGDMLVCPDFSRCANRYQCPIHGWMLTEPEIEPATCRDVAFYVESGLLRKKLVDSCIVENPAPFEPRSKALLATLRKLGLPT